MMEQVHQSGLFNQPWMNPMMMPRMYQGVPHMQPPMQIVQDQPKEEIKANE